MFESAVFGSSLRSILMSLFITVLSESIVSWLVLTEVRAFVVLILIPLFKVTAPLATILLLNVAVPVNAALPIKASPVSFTLNNALVLEVS